MMILGFVSIGFWIRLLLIVFFSGNFGYFFVIGGWLREKTTGKLKGNCFFRIWKLRSIFYVRIGFICYWMIYITVFFFYLVYLLKFICIVILVFLVYIYFGNIKI